LSENVCRTKYVKFRKKFPLFGYCMIQKCVTSGNQSQCVPRSSPYIPMSDESEKNFSLSGRGRAFYIKDSSQVLSALHKGLISFCSLSLVSRDLIHLSLRLVTLSNPPLALFRSSGCTYGDCNSFHSLIRVRRAMR
jgi:hypothetical protein